MNEVSKSDWKLYRSKIAQWQEDYMGRLVKEHITMLQADADASEKFCELEKRTTSSVSIGVPDIDTLPSIHADFLQLKEEKWVQPKEDLFGMFFKSSTTEEKEPVLETTYYYQAWRDHAAAIVMPTAEEVLQAYYELIQSYEDKVANLYISHLEMLVSEKTHEKEEVSSNLSEDEQKLQNNNNWLSTFVDQLQVIERR